MRKENLQTEFIHATGKHCEHCWKCVEACPKGVIGKINFLFHKHAVILNPKNCIGCFKCVKACRYGAIGKGGAL